MNKEQFRKELEDCWGCATARSIGDMAKITVEGVPDRDTYITTRLAALDDGSGWVSVNERLPKKNEEYIVCGTGFEGKIVTTLEWKKGKWFSDVYQKYIEQIKITHWQPLPKSPNNDN